MPIIDEELLDGTRQEEAQAKALRKLPQGAAAAVNMQEIRWDSNIEEWRSTLLKLDMVWDEPSRNWTVKLQNSVFPGARQDSAGNVYLPDVNRYYKAYTLQPDHTYLNSQGVQYYKPLGRPYLLIKTFPGRNGDLVDSRGITVSQIASTTPAFPAPSRGTTVWQIAWTTPAFPAPSRHGESSGPQHSLGSDQHSHVVRRHREAHVISSSDVFFPKQRSS